MENINIYENIGRRTGGDIYLGIVGPVRAGKSTFIKRFMDLMVIPNVKNTYEKQRILDEMPQSGTGRIITTTEPKFIPAEAAKLELDSGMELRVRLVDCVGYLIPGAMGHMEDGESRMVSTPWDENRIPFELAAEIGTEKVIKDHSTVGIVVTTDGSIGTMARTDYIEAEERVIKQLQELNKPFVVILNSMQPDSSAALAAADEISDRYSVPVLRIDCARATEEEMGGVIMTLLGRFPVREINFKVPGYVEGLSNEHWLKDELADIIMNWADSLNSVEDLRLRVCEAADGEIIESALLRRIDMGTGEADVQLELAGNLYYRIITELMEEPVENDCEFFRLLKEFAIARKAYGKLRTAMEQVEARGYGIVEPKLNEMVISEPEVFKEGSKYGVRITAKAPTLHIIKTDITTEISPVVGSEKQSEELVASLRADMKDSPDGIWNTNIFGKSLYEMVAEQMENKIASVPDNIRIKMQKSLQKISDEGKEYFICIVI